MLNECNRGIPGCVDNVTGETTIDPDFPYSNFSAETPDIFRYRGFVFGPGIDDPDNPWRFSVQGCKTLCESTVSLEEALLCAARQAILCANNPNNGGGVFPPIVINPWSPPPPNTGGGIGGGPDPGGNGGTTGNPGTGTTPDPTTGGGTGGGPNPGGGGTTLYRSAATSCSVTCPDGSVFTKEVEEGKFIALTQAQADKQAETYACARAKIERICLTPPVTDYYCSGKELREDIFVSGGSGPYSVEVEGLPAGVYAQSNETGTKITVAGTPTSYGDHNPKVTATDAFGNSQSVQFSMPVLGIMPKADGPIEIKVGCGWTQDLQGVGPWNGSAQFYGAGVPGLTVNPSGTVSGVATQKGNYTFCVYGYDDHHLCSKCFEVEVVDCTGSSTSFSAALFSNNSPTTQTLTVPASLCKKLYTITSSPSVKISAGGGPPSCCYATVKVTTRKNGVQTGFWIASTNGAFGGTINGAITVGPDYDPEDPCVLIPNTYEVFIEFICGKQLGCPDETVCPMGMKVAVDFYGFV